MPLKSAWGGWLAGRRGCGRARANTAVKPAKGPLTDAFKAPQVVPYEGPGGQVASLRRNRRETRFGRMGQGERHTVVCIFRMRLPQIWRRERRLRPLNTPACSSWMKFPSR